MSRNTRDLNIQEATTLPPGSEHYRAYVGPPSQYDFMGATQFRLVCALGLREHHKILDFGCGSLRLGRLLIPYLLPQRYYGIEPAKWLVEDGLNGELGQSILEVKRPSFKYNDDMDCSVFGIKFDYIIAQSILTHCGIDLAKRSLVQFSHVVAERGLILFSFVKVPDEEEGNTRTGWHYPECVAYNERQVNDFVEKAGLRGTSIPWFHPRCTWYVASRNAEMLPNALDKRHLRGVVLNDPQFAASISNLASKP